MLEISDPGMTHKEVMIEDYASLDIFLRPVPFPSRKLRSDPSGNQAEDHRGRART